VFEKEPPAGTGGIKAEKLFGKHFYISKAWKP
jgi:hypothetical protein